MITVRSVINLAAVLIVIAGFIWNRKEARGRLEDRIFEFLCASAVGAAVIRFGADWLSTVLTGNGRVWGAAGVNYLSDMIRLIILFQWILFADYMFCRSKDHLRRERKTIYTGFGVIAAIDAVWIVCSVCIEQYTEIDKMMPALLWTAISCYAMRVVELAVLVKAVRKYTGYESRKKKLRKYGVMKLAAGIVTGVILVMVVADLLGLVPLAISLILIVMLIIMSQDRSYHDRETDLFNTRFLQFMTRVDGRTEFKCGMLIYIKAEDPERVLPRILKEDQPEEMITFVLGRREYLLAGERKPDVLVQLLIRNLREDAEAENVKLLVSYGTRRDDESFDSFMNRVKESDLK